MKAAKLRDMTAEEIQREIEQLREQIYRLRFQAGSGQTENPVRIRWVRRDLARALTVLGQKRRGAAAGSAT
jgi:large subunit ribosomal protein L29